MSSDATMGSTLDPGRSPMDGRTLQEVARARALELPAATLSRPSTLVEDLVRELVTDSYLLVVEGLPRAQRPVDPDTFLAHGAQRT